MFFSGFYRAKNITRVGTKFGGFAARVSSRVCPCTVRASSRELLFALRQNPLTWKAVNGMKAHFFVNAGDGLASLAVLPAFPENLVF